MVASDTLVIWESCEWTVFLGRGRTTWSCAPSSYGSDEVDMFVVMMIPTTLMAPFFVFPTVRTGKSDITRVKIAECESYSRNRVQRR